MYFNFKYCRSSIQTINVRITLIKKFFFISTMSPCIYVCMSSQ